MERRGSPLIGAADRLYLERAYELAERATGNTSPNPRVGAVVVRDGHVIGEGYHHRAGSPHAETEALAQAGDAARGATLYVSLEPCNHTGKTPPCSRAVIDAKIARAVIGTVDPNPRTARGGVRALKAAGISVEIADDPRARALIEPFAGAVDDTARPFLAVKLATSLDGFIATTPGVQQWLTGAEARDAVRSLRIEYDAVMVGAGTVRVDDPQLTVRPPHLRLRPYVRVIVCETSPVDARRKIFAPEPGYAPTIVLGPQAVAQTMSGVENADVLGVGASAELDIAAGMRALREHGVQSVLCEGGPTLASRLLALGLVDRIYWLVAPAMLEGPNAVAALTESAKRRVPSIVVDGVERLGEDLMLTGTVQRV